MCTKKKSNKAKDDGDDIDVSQSLWPARCLQGLVADDKYVRMKFVRESVRSMSMMLGEVFVGYDDYDGGEIW